MTNDAGFHYVRDTMAQAADAGTMPTTGYRPASKSVKDCRLSASSAPRIRSVNAVGITGGAVEGSTIDPGMNWGKRPSNRKDRNHARPGKNARKRAAKRNSA